ncbi:MAG: zf-HC2 domain-containing protein [Candidatus Omnitrophica bacterium]|nr:zf-HC2 domain-containing protein [Candidatus Omnitrophota bacterium]MBU1852501.1 zf-HC2 domain-containing protein [Candidatus Omnitrophota bacterium]
MDCLNEKVLSSYLDERLSEDERRRIDGHISKCNRCLDLLIVAYEAQAKSRKVSSLLKERVKKRLGVKQKKARPELKWLLGALFLFALSFIVKRFFMQFLVGAAILGFKWAMEGEGAKRAVMIFKGIEKKEKNFERKSPPPVSDINEDTTYGTK